MKLNFKKAKEYILGEIKAVSPVSEKELRGFVRTQLGTEYLPLISFLLKELVLDNKIEIYDCDDEVLELQKTNPELVAYVNI